ncbi:AAA family ATPase [bacterium]|nr:AAA family ATPase [bacterium]
MADQKTLHMSMKLNWHDHGWDGGTPSESPCENTSVNAFGVGKEPVKVLIPKEGFAEKDIEIDIPKATACTWPEKTVLEVVQRAGTHNPSMYMEAADNYFKKFKKGKSLIFYYLDRNNQFCENEEHFPIIIGISKFKEAGGRYFYPPAYYMGKKKETAVFQKPVTSTYPEGEGFCIPLWKCMNNEELDGYFEKLILKPKKLSPFKYDTCEIDNDDAIEIVRQLLEVVNVLIDIKDDSEKNWEEKRDWLNSVLNELWEDRGPYPGFPSVLEFLQLGKLVSKFTELPTFLEMKTYKDEVREFLERKKDNVRGETFDENELSTIRKNYQILKEEGKVDFLFDTLSRFDISTKQLENIIDNNRKEKASILASIEEMTENPYIICEQYIGSDDKDDIIPFYKIDDGVIPPSTYKLKTILNIDAAERLRALCVDELKNRSDSFVKAENLLEAINSSIDTKTEKQRWKNFKLNDFNKNPEVFNKALFCRTENDTLYLYLKEIREDEEIIAETLQELVKREDLGIPSNLKKRFEETLRQASKIKNYDDILDHQAEICAKIFPKHLSVLSGAAGTGKTTVIKAIIKNIKATDGELSGFRLLAPTGKATERVKALTNNENATSTIHSFLARQGWLNENLTLKRSGGEICSDIRTLIIDECSMIDLNLFATLVRAIDWSKIERLILVGDPNQLPPIGKGKVFVDIIKWLNKNYKDNVGKLTDNIRQLKNKSEGNDCGILDLAENFIQENAGSNDKKFNENSNYPDLGILRWHDQKDLEDQLIECMKEDMREYMLDKKGAYPDEQLWQDSIDKNPERVQVISPFRGKFYGVRSLNLLMQKTFNPSGSLKLLDGIGCNDKVIQIRNRPLKSNPAYAYNGKYNIEAEIFNGEIGISYKHGFDKKKDSMSVTRFQVAFSGKSRQGLLYNYGKSLGKYREDNEDKNIPEQKVSANLELAYAISVHKSQGSEFDYVYIVIPDRNSDFLSMELIYTAITRAQKKATLLIHKDFNLLSLSNIKKSAVRKINSSVFEFKPISETCDRSEEQNLAEEEKLRNIHV